MLPDKVTIHLAAASRATPDLGFCTGTALDFEMRSLVVNVGAVYDNASCAGGSGLVEQCCQTR